MLTKMACCIGAVGSNIGVVLNTFCPAVVGTSHKENFDIFEFSGHASLDTLEVK